MKNSSVLRVSQLFKQFNSNIAVNKISFEVKQGEILGFLGSNGAGKTTTIQMLLSTMSPTSGQIEYFGKNFFTHRSEILQQISFASTYVKLPGKLTIYENLDFYAQIYGISYSDRKSTIEKFLKYFDMWNFRDRPAGVLSAGETTRVILAKAFMARPKVVLLDEPTASLDPDIAHEVRHFVLEQQKNQGVSILFTSHNMDEVAAVCNRVLVLSKGNIIANNTPEQLAASVSRSKINLVLEDIITAENFFKEHSFVYKVYDKSVEVEIDEHSIAKFLIKLAKANITYTTISIDKPTLEDYFLHTVRKNRSRTTSKS